MSNCSFEDLLNITRRLDKIIELLQPVKSDVINRGDKVIYDGNEYYYVGWSDNVHVLGDRFLRAMIGVKNGDLIRKEMLKKPKPEPKNKVKVGD